MSCPRIVFPAAWILLATFVMSAGCSNEPPKRNAKPDKSTLEVPDTLEAQDRLWREHLAWKRRATALLNRIVDEPSAKAAIPELTTLVNELEVIYARGNLRKTPLPKEMVAELKKRHGKESEEVTKRYIDALHPYELQGKKAPLDKYVDKTFDISIIRMRFVKREN